MLWVSELCKSVLRVAARSQCGNEQMQVTLGATLRDESVQRSRNIWPAWIGAARTLWFIRVWRVHEDCAAFVAAAACAAEAAFVVSVF